MGRGGAGGISAKTDIDKGTLIGDYTRIRNRNCNGEVKYSSKLTSSFNSFSERKCMRGKIEELLVARISLYFQHKTKRNTLLINYTPRLPRNRRVVK